ncbi:MAG: alpha/beta fold hydrolase [Alphaproteobacteria bacterium]|nr:alpha/beta fold hydrolase [Alphaproteobacteria bacterium]
MSLVRAFLIAIAVVATVYGGFRLLRALERPETRLESVRCWFNPPPLRSAQCFRFTAPESRETASNRVVRIPVVILRSPSTPPDEPPVLHLMGGPGQPAGIATSRGVAAWARLLNRDQWARDRDHILVDTRGVGVLASPRLRCAALSDTRWALRLDALGDGPEAIREIDKTVGACRAAFARAGVDLGAYDTEAAARDLADLRRALKLPGWTVYGISYGARLALELMRIDPGGVHAAILDSVPPPDQPLLTTLLPDMQHSLDLLYADCRASTECHGAYPELRRSLERTVIRLRGHPVNLSVRKPKGSATLSLRLDDGTYLQILEYGLMTGGWLPFLPGIIDDTAKGGTKLLAHLATAAAFDPYGETDSNGVLLSSLCREELPYNPENALDQARTGHPLLRGMDMTAMLRAECRAWSVGEAPRAFRQPVESDVPTLFVNGAYDTRTPPRFAERQAAHMANGIRLVLRARGHAPSRSSACAKAAMAAFLDAPRGAEPPACVRFQAPPHFLSRRGPEAAIKNL